MCPLSLSLSLSLSLYYPPYLEIDTRAPVQGVVGGVHVESIQKFCDIHRTNISSKGAYNLETFNGRKNQNSGKSHKIRWYPQKKSRPDV